MRSSLSALDQALTKPNQLTQPLLPNGAPQKSNHGNSISDSVEDQLVPGEPTRQDEHKSEKHLGKRISDQSVQQTPGRAGLHLQI